MIKRTVLFAALAACGVAAGRPCVRIGGPAGAQMRELPVEEMRCSAMPVNIRWPGHQREIDQTEICHFARFDFRGETRVRVSVPEGTREVVVRPVARKVAVSREGDVAAFTLKSAGAYSVEFDGRHRNLMVFADPPHDWSGVDRTAANVRWFGPGEHEAGVIRPKAGETIYLDEGAVVYGRIEARDADGLRICGRGILDASRVKEVPVEIDPKLAEEQRRKGWAITNVERFDAIRLMFCDNVRIEGITVRDSQIYAIRPVCCDDFTVDNVRILGSWRYNSDGIDMHNCRRVRIRDSFIRTYDDSICVKGFDYVLPEGEMLHEGVLHDVFEDVLVERCTIWNDWGRALEIGAETRAREIRDVTFRDCDVIAVHDVALDVQNCDQAHVRGIVFEDIRVEYDPEAPKTVYSAAAKDFDPRSRRGLAPLAGLVIHYIPEYSKAGAENRGRTSGVAFRNIDVFAPEMPSGFCRGFDAAHRVTDVTFSGVRLNGRDVTADFVASVATNAFGSVSCAGAAGEWPFAILRSYGSYEENKLFTERVFAAQERHPGLFGEIWFGGDGGLDYTAEERGKLAEKTNPGIRERCHRLGIAFSYQQGVTLNHGEDGLKRDFIPEDAWAVSRDGRPAYGILCCTSPWALDYQRETAKAIMGRLKPDSYWPDDDMRLLKGDWNAAYYCFCDRCVKLFGESYGQAFTRETLVRALNGPDGSAEVRKAWCGFNGRNLGACAKVYREAADAVSPKTRLGIQIALSGNTVDGDSWKTMVQALAGKGGRAGTRPGGLYYCDSKPHELLWKMQLVAREAARSGGLPEIGQICYEVENWPHVGGHKNAHGMMAECAWALASGCDSIAFYWGADQNGEDAASHDFWLEAVWAWRPFHLAVRDAFAGTRLGGVAAYHGANHWATKGWANHDEMEMSALMMCAVPVTVTEAAPDALWLNERCVETLAEGDLKGVFAKPVVMSAAAFAALGKRFPRLAFAKKVACEFPGSEKAPATAKRANGYELFPSGLKCENVKAYILPKSADVKAFSAMTADAKACGTCVVPTEFGGRVVVAQEVPAHSPHVVWPGCRRHAILDALDFATPGGLPARLLTDGYSVAVTVRTDAAGRTAGVFLLNLGSGETPPVELAIRRGVAQDWRVSLPRRGSAAADVVRRTAAETVVRLPPLGAYGAVLVAP